MNFSVQAMLLRGFPEEVFPYIYKRRVQFFAGIPLLFLREKNIAWKPAGRFENIRRCKDLVPIGGMPC